MVIRVGDWLHVVCFMISRKCIDDVTITEHENLNMHVLLMRISLLDCSKSTTDTPVRKEYKCHLYVTFNIQLKLVLTASAGTRKVTLCGQVSICMR